MIWLLPMPWPLVLAVGLLWVVLIIPMGAVFYRWMPDDLSGSTFAGFIWPMALLYVLLIACVAAVARAIESAARWRA